MATQQRKASREKAFIAAGRKAREIEQRATSTIDSLKETVVRLTRELKMTTLKLKSFSEANAFQAKNFEKLREQDDKRGALIAVLRDDLDCERRRVNELARENKRLRTKLDDFNDMDRDAKKLRRRLAESKERVLELQTSLNREKRSEAF